MELPLIAALIAGWAVLGAMPWWYTAIQWVFHQNANPRDLADLPDDPPENGWPTVALIFAADEAENVEDGHAFDARPRLSWLRAHRRR